MLTTPVFLSNKLSLFIKKSGNKFTANYLGGIPVPGRSVPSIRIFELYAKSCAPNHRSSAIVDQLSNVISHFMKFLLLTSSHWVEPIIKQGLNNFSYFSSLQQNILKATGKGGYEWYCQWLVQFAISVCWRYRCYETDGQMVRGMEFSSIFSSIFWRKRNYC